MHWSPEDAARRLRDALAHSDEPLRLAALQALLESGVLVKALEPGSGTLSYDAVQALRALGDRATSALVAALGHAHPHVRFQAAELLAQRGDVAAADELAASLSSSNGATRDRAAELLARLGDPRAIPQLLQLAASEHEADRAVWLLTGLLERSAGRVSTEHLQLLAGLGDVTERRYGDDDFLGRASLVAVDDVDCTRLRTLARAEAARRAGSASP